MNEIEVVLVNFDGDATKVKFPEAILDAGVIVRQNLLLGQPRVFRYEGKPSSNMRESHVFREVDALWTDKVIDHYDEEEY